MQSSTSLSFGAMSRTEVYFIELAQYRLATCADADDIDPEGNGTQELLKIKLEDDCTQEGD